MASEFLYRLVMELALVNLKIRSMIYINVTLNKMTDNLFVRQCTYCIVTVRMSSINLEF
jgi:hypothetical protein